MLTACNPACPLSISLLTARLDGTRFSSSTTWGVCAVGAAIPLYCERCGVGAPLSTARVHFSFCPNCEFTVCAACWDAGAIRCNDCASQISERDGSSTSVAHRALFQLSALVRELEEVERQARTGSGEAAAATNERWPYGLAAEVALLEISARDLARIARVAIDESGARDQRAALDLVTRLNDTVEDIERHLVRADLAVQQSTDPISPLELQPSSPAPSTPRPIARAKLRASVFVGVLLLVAGVVALTRFAERDASDARTTALGSARPATVNGGVVAGRSSPRPRQSTAKQVSTFDDLRMNARLGEGWRIEGDPAAVRVAPIPTVVDRSLELSPSTGGSTSACRAVPSGLTDRPLKVVVDFMAASARPMGVTVRGQGGDLELSIYGPRRRRDVAQRVDGGRWYRALMRADPDGWQWELTDLAADRRVLRATSVAGSIRSVELFCASLHASRGTELYVDDLTMSSAE